MKFAQVRRHLVWAPTLIPQLFPSLKAGPRRIHDHAQVERRGAPDNPAPWLSDLVVIEMDLFSVVNSISCNVREVIATCGSLM